MFVWIRYDYSFISRAAIRIGEDILEIGSWGDYSFNGVHHADMPLTMSGNVSVAFTPKNEKENVFDIYVGNTKEHIKVKTFKDFVNVRIENGSHASFEGSRGLMGAYGSGAMLARDGKTILEDPKDFGQERQVGRGENESSLFQVPGSPVYPEQCIFPSPKTLRDNAGAAVTKQAAEKACASWGQDGKKRCVADAVSTGDLELAQAGDYY